MGVVRTVCFHLLDDEGVKRGALRIEVLPRVPDDAAVLWDYRKEPGPDSTMEPVQILENEEYHYEFLPAAPLPEGAVIEMSHPELFDAEKRTGVSGRLRPKLYTGSIQVQVWVGSTTWGRVILEVRSAKFDYQKHYRWMLEDIAAEFTEFIMERFAAAEQRFTLTDAKDATTLYQRFAFLKYLISGEQFEAAMNQILGRPHRAWVVEEESRPPQRGVAANSSIGRQIAGGVGPHAHWPGGPVAWLPARLRVDRTEESLDTPENRFIKFALVRWRDVVADVEAILGREKENSPVARGKAEARTVRERLEELLADGLFDEVGKLVQFPAASQVLQRREGYRDIFRAYVQFEAGAALAWEGGDDVYRAGQRNVAALYEYWVFLQLRKAVAALCDSALHEEQLYTLGDGLTIKLKRGRQLLLSGKTTVHGRIMRLSLYYNKGFGRGGNGSWTMPLRPDCSLRIWPDPKSPTRFEEVWLHFDAKYRIDNMTQLFGKKEQPEEDYLAEEEATEEEIGKAKHQDLLKMHAYRDAIRKSAGSYVIYPGTRSEEPFRMYHELLPGLGAFALRPVEGGSPDGLGTLQKFLRDVLAHMASQTTQHERGRYWERQAYDPMLYIKDVVAAASFVTQPPADTKVMIGWLKGPGHQRWVQRENLYNVRADARPGAVQLSSEALTVQLVLLYSERMGLFELWEVVGNPVVMMRQSMLDTGYPDPNGEYYYCLPIRQVDVSPWRERLSVQRIQAIRQGKVPVPPNHAPLVATWLDLVR